MSKFVQYVEPEEATGNVKEIYDVVEQKFGQVLNVVKTLGNSPEGLDGVMSAMGALEHFDLSPKYVELAYLKASSVNECEYWFTHHTASGLEAGLTEEQIDQLDGFESSNLFSDTEQNILRFADQLTREAEVDDRVMNALKDEFSDQNLVELTITVSVANMVNRINEGLSMPLEE